MPFFFGESFDLYQSSADLVTYWDPTSDPNNGFGTGRFSNSRCIQLGNGRWLYKTSGQNDGTHHFTLAYQTNGLGGSPGNVGMTIQLFDGATVQCSVNFMTYGDIQLVQGGWNSGSILATYQNAVAAPNVWVTFEIEVVISNTNGSLAVRKNGNNVNDFFLGSLNTQSSGNLFANKIGMTSTTYNYNEWVDDFLWRSGTTVPWIGDVRCYTRYPSADVSVQFSRTVNPLTQALWGNNTYGVGLSANVAYYAPFTANASGLLTSVIVTPNGNNLGHIKYAIYAPTPTGGVGSVMTTSAEGANPSSSPFTLTFPVAPRVTAGQQYWIGWNQDATINYTGNYVGGIISGPSSYSTWPVANPGGTPQNQYVPNVSVVITPQYNADAVNEPQQDALNSYVYSSTPGQVDYYQISAIPVTPVKIVGTTVRGYFQKSDVGTRVATILLQSGNQLVQGQATALSTNWAWIWRSDTVDPNTGAAWTASAVNAVYIGPAVTA